MSEARRIQRGFVAIDEGQVHYRTAGRERAGAATALSLRGTAETVEAFLAER